MSSITLQSAIFPTLKLSVDDKEYTLCFPIPAVIAAEEASGHSLKTLHDWLNIEIKHIPAVIRAGLSKYHAQISETEVQNIIGNLTPEAVDEVHYALCKLAFPRAMALLESKAKETSSPNAQSPAAAA